MSGSTNLYLRRPYSRVLIPDEDTGTFAARILEFPGCVAQGRSPEEAYRRLEEAAESWLQAAIDLGQEIPEPAADISYSGKMALRMPKSLHKTAAELAEREGVSLNQFVVSAVAEKVGATKLYSELAGRFNTLSFVSLETPCVAFLASDLTPQKKASTLGTILSTEEGTFSVVRKEVH